MFEPENLIEFAGAQQRAAIIDKRGGPGMRQADRMQGPLLHGPDRLRKAM